MADDLKTGDRMARAAMTTEPMAKKIAERYLASRGYEILARDWRCGGESVDIVAKDGDVAVLVDVAAGGGELGGEFAEVEAAADRLVRGGGAFLRSLRHRERRMQDRLPALQAPRPRPRHDQALHRRRRRRARLLGAHPETRQAIPGSRRKAPRAHSLGGPFAERH